MLPDEFQPWLRPRGHWFDGPRRKDKKLMCIANPKGEALHWGPIEDFGRMILPKKSLLSLSWFKNAYGGSEARRQNDWYQMWHSVCSGAQVPWATVAGVYEQRRTTRLIHCMHYIFRRRAVPSDSIWKRYESQRRNQTSSQNPPWGIQGRASPLGFATRVPSLN